MAKYTPEDDSGDSIRESAEIPEASPESIRNPWRPSVYDPAMLDLVLLSTAKGATIEAIAWSCGIHHNNFYR